LIDKSLGRHHLEFRPFAPGDEVAISEIYNYYITDTVVTFEEQPLSPEQMRERIEGYLIDYPWFVCAIENVVVGYSYASKFHQRAAYRHTVELAVYLRRGFERRGIGRALYEGLIKHLEASDCHAMLAAIALPNAGSVGLHEALGFSKVAHFSRVGHKFGRWIDVGYWQRFVA
jgi:phosphinothricin acetyltransferase